MTTRELRLGRLEQAQSTRQRNRLRAERARLHVPNIIEFVTSPGYLDRPNLYPRQATLLKIATLQEELFTEYDLGVIADWESGFELTDRDLEQHWEGRRGMPPGTLDRMRVCEADGRLWFREIVFVLGRRAGKGYVGSLLTAYLLWNLLALGDPQTELGIERTKQILIMTVAADKAQAATNLHRDISELLTTSPCFAPYVGRANSLSVRLRTPADIARSADSAGSILVEARAATPTAGRGPAAIGLLFDEMAHAPASGLQRGADEIYRAARPALSQFPSMSLTLLPSSPASQVGEYYAAYRRGLEAEDEQPVDPTMLVVQLPSTETYLDWELTHDGLPMWPDGPDFARLDRAIIAPGAELDRIRRSNLDMYKVEYEAQWRSSLDAYLDPELVRQIFDREGEPPLSMRHDGVAGNRYVMHCDPSTSGANFGIAIGHLDGDTSTGTVVFDYLHAFIPGDFTDGRIDYAFVEAQVANLITAFRPSIVSFDQYNGEQMMQNLRAGFHGSFGFGQLNISTRTATASRNWMDAERFKTFMGEGRVRAPHHELARDELLFLERRNMTVDHPATGPVTTSDIADCMFNVVAHLADGSADIHAQMSAVNMRPSAGFVPSSHDAAVFSQMSSGRRRGPGRESYNPARGLRRGL